MEDEYLQKVIQFVSRQRWFNGETLTSDTTLEEDLDITGDDADDFMLEFFTEFDISYESFGPGRYFGGEGMHVPILTPLLWRLWNRTPFPDPPVHDLTLGDLARVLRAGKWVDPPEISD